MLPALIAAGSIVALLLYGDDKDVQNGDPVNKPIYDAIKNGKKKRYKKVKK